MARYIFWFAQVIGFVSVFGLIVFIGGNLTTELINKEITISEDYSVFLFFFCEILVAITIINSWKRKRLGPVLILAFTIMIVIIWGREDIHIMLLHLPLLFSGLLLLFYSFYKEWILKQKP